MCHQSQKIKVKIQVYREKSSLEFQNQTVI